MTIVNLKNVSKSFKNNTVLDNFSAAVCSGEFLAITGPSGCGKSTLLNIIGLLEDFDSGEYELFGERNIPAGSRAASRLLKEKIGYLFQNCALVDDETVYDNLSLAIIERKSKEEKTNAIWSALREVGLSEEYLYRPIFTLSGGEQQLVLADEPTGSLDTANREVIINLLRELNEKRKATVIIVTHDEYVASRCDRVISMTKPNNT